jgi:hypothetical protein
VTTTAVDPSANTYVNTYSSGGQFKRHVELDELLLRGSTHKLNGDFQQRQRHRRDGFVGATTYIFTGLTANTEYYIRTTPYISAGFLVNQYISDFTLPSITSISATTATDDDRRGVGLYDTTTVPYNTSGVFDVSGVPVCRRTGCLADDHWRVVVQHAVLFQGDAVFVRWGGGGG